MLYRSISRAEAAPSAKATARSRILAARRTRSGAVSRFESSTPAIARTSGGMTTAQATTGPARGPRPTSSMPAMSGPFPARSSRSSGLQRAMQLLRRAAGLWHLHLRLALLDARGLAGEVAEIIELRAAHLAAAHDDDVAEHRAVEWEDALDADTVRDLAHGERLADAAAALGDAHALERLEPLLLPFAHAHVHPEGVTRPEWRDVAAGPLFLRFDEGMHMTIGSGGWTEGWTR